jgi:hypothetical protein
MPLTNKAIEKLQSTVDRLPPVAFMCIGKDSRTVWSRTITGAELAGLKGGLEDISIRVQTDE